MAERWSEKEVWALVGLIEVKENFLVLYGKLDSTDNTSGDSKATVYGRIAQKLDPALYKADSKKAFNRVKSKISRLESQFKQQMKRLRKTGEGIQETAYYIAPQGPDHDTDSTAVNIWQEITKTFIYFPTLYKIWSTRPNMAPICATTGVGPCGPQTIILQPPAPASGMPSSPSTSFAGQSVTRTLSNSNIDPLLLNEDMQRAGASAAPQSLSAPSTPLSNKENAPPLPGVRGPRLSSFGTPRDNAKPTVSIIPQKRGVEEELVDVQREMLRNMSSRATQSLTLKRRKMELQETDKRRGSLERRRAVLLEEFKMDIWTPEEYREQVKGIRAEEEALDKRDVSPDCAASPPLRAVSPFHAVLPFRAVSPFHAASPERAASPSWDQRLLDRDIEGDEI